MDPNPVGRVRRKLKSSEKSTFCTWYLTFTTHLRPPCACYISLGQYLSDGLNHIENGPNGVELWLKTVTFWLDRAPPRSGMPTKNKVKKKKNSTKKWSLTKSLGTSGVSQEAQSRSQKQISPQFGLRVVILVFLNFFRIPPSISPVLYGLRSFFFLH